MANTLERPNLIIFDCDGVLVDSELISTSILYNTINKYGYVISKEEVFSRFLGKSLKTTIIELEKDFKVKLTLNDIEIMKEEVLNNFSLYLEPVDGITQFLESYHGDICVASSSYPERIKHSLQQTKLLRFFNNTHIFSATMVKFGKPAPDLFLFAAKKMGYKPNQCIVIEDSSYGIQAAKSAGMMAVGLIAASHMKSKENLKKLECSGADYVVDSYNELKNILK